ncbi:MAG: FtsQ-type POTRA domain-containing protein [Candidatus Staskawiczbacteria bacterium]|nr:FtsQ-type POTRA domain-containing protein [Candidatus Staskawiczbacteria bacterium]
MSYRKKHIKVKIHKIKPKKSILKNKWFWIAILFLAVIIFAFYFLFFYPGIQVKNIEISGNQKIQSQDIKNLVSHSVDSKSIFFINSGKISKEILEKFPAIEKVAVNKNFPQTLALDIAERKSVGAYCLSASSEQANNNCFSIDKNGIVFETAEGNPDNLTIMQTGENKDVFIGQEAVAENIIDAIYKIKKILKDNFQIDLKTALVASSAKLDITTKENWQIYFDLGPDSDVNSQIVKLNLLLDKGISQDSRKNLRYIDLRPKDRAIVCDNKTCGG